MIKMKKKLNEKYSKKKIYHKHTKKLHKHNKFVE